MDVHKEAIVIVVLNGSGKLVMESVVETKARSILQFIHGLRGELHVTWEEGMRASTQPARGSAIEFACPIGLIILVDDGEPIVYRRQGA